MNLDSTGWKSFRFGELLDEIYKAKAHAKVELTVSNKKKEGYIPFVTRTDNCNGVDCYVLESDLISIEDGNAIVIGDTTSTISYQPNAFGTGDHMIVIRASWLNCYTGLFITSLLQKERFRYSYGRAFLIDLIKDTTILLPINNKKNPDWVWVENYIKTLHHKPISTKVSSSKKSVISICEWKPFLIGDMFDIHPTKAYKNMSKQDLLDEKGTTPFVVNSADNNGIGGFSLFEATEKGGIITFSDTTDGNTFFYQPVDFIGFAHVQGMYSRNRTWSKYELLFLVTILTHVNYGRYNYGRKMTRDNILNTYVYLPADNKGKPDWLFMNQYIQQLPYSDRI